MADARLAVDRRQRAPFRRRKADTLRIVEGLHGVGFTPEQIAASMTLTVRRVRQVMTFLRLGQARFETVGEGLTWLAKERAELDYDLRVYRYFRLGKDTQHEEEAAA